MTPSPASALLGSLAALALAALPVSAQNAAPAGPAFDVASIKPAAPPSASGGRVTIFSGCNGGPGTNDPGRWNCGFTSLSTMVTLAYDIKRYQLTAPDWMDSTRFDITASIPAGTTKEQMRLMEQDLLARRFGLTLHHLPKELPSEVLTVAKGGAKLKESVAPPPHADPTAPPQPATLGQVKMGPDGFPTAPPAMAGRTMMMFANGHMRAQADGTTLDNWVGFLSNQLGEPVVNGTGLTGTYDIQLDFSPESSPNGMMAGGMVMATRVGGAAPDGGATDQQAPAPPLRAALQEQLGLKLESKKAMLDTIVIDRCEKAPTDN